MAWYNEIGDFLSDTWDSVKDVGGEVVEAVGDFYEGVGDYLLEWSPYVAPVIGGMIGGPLGATVAGSMTAIGSAHNSKEQLESEQAFNAQQAQLNRDFQLQMWNANNQYNSAVAQLQRLAQAGINPNLAFDSGYKSATASAPAGSQAAGSPSIAGQMLLFNSTLEQMRAQTDKINSETALNKQTYDWNTATQDERYKGMINMNDKDRAEIDKLISDRKIQEETFRLFSEMNDEKLKITRQELVNLRNQNLQIIENINKTKAEISNINAQTEKVHSDIYATDMSSLDTSITAQYNALKLQHSQTMGMPAGTPAQEAMFRLWLDGKDAQYIGLLRANANLEGTKSTINREILGLFGSQANAVDNYDGDLQIQIAPPRPVYMPNRHGR